MNKGLSRTPEFRGLGDFGTRSELKVLIAPGGALGYVPDCCDIKQRDCFIPVFPSFMTIVFSLTPFYNIKLRFIPKFLNIVLFFR